MSRNSDTLSNFGCTSTDYYPFIIKGIDFIDLPSMFRDNTVESSIPDYFENKELPVICYEYNKPT